MDDILGPKLKKFICEFANILEQVTGYSVWPPWPSGPAPIDDSCVCINLPFFTTKLCELVHVIYSYTRKIIITILNK